MSEAFRKALADLGNATGPAEQVVPSDWDAVLFAADEVHAQAGPVLARSDALEAMLRQVVDHHDQLLASIGEPDGVYAVALTRLHASLDGARALLAAAPAGPTERTTP